MAKTLVAKKALPAKVVAKAPAKKVAKPEAEYVGTKKSSKAAPKVPAKVVAKAPAKKVAGKAVVEYIPNVEKMNKTKLVNFLMEGEHAPTKKQVVGVLADIEQLLLGSLHKKGAGEFMMPGLFKVVVKQIPAKPRRFGKNNFTGVDQWFEAKPATVRVKMRPLKKIKDAASAK